MSFTDQKRRVATDNDLTRHWSGEPNGKRFRCYLCGVKFKAGDGWRWVYSAGATFTTESGKWGMINFMTCDPCDGPDVIDRWVKLHEEFHQPKFWALH
jgi:hypothetical protein